MSESEPPPESNDTAPAAQLAAVQAALEQARETITALERRQKIDLLLAASEPVDMEVARLLTEAAVQAMDEPDVKLAIADLRRHKPYLFRRDNRRAGGASLGPTAGAMTARVTDDHPARAAAQRAAQSGDRKDLLRYLRLRRGK